MAEIEILRYLAIMQQTFSKKYEKWIGINIVPVSPYGSGLGSEVYKKKILNWKIWIDFLKNPIAN
jgi:hypothetical protein